MSTSGSVNYNETRNQLILDALAYIGVYGIGRTVSADDMAIASGTLNRIIKECQTDGLHLWSKEEAYLFPTLNTGNYTLSADSTSARACLRSEAVLTYLTAAASTSASSLTVADTTGMAIGHPIGIVLDDGTVSWTTIATIPSSTTVTISGTIPSASAANNNVYSYTSRINKPLKILGMRRVTEGPANASAIPMLMLSHQEYFDLPNKNINGLATHFYYNPDLTTGNLYLWPRPNDPNMYFEMTFERMLEDVDSAGDNLDFPSEWQRAIMLLLARDLLLPFGKTNMYPVLAEMAKEAYDKVCGFDQESASVRFMPETYYR